MPAYSFQERFVPFILDGSKSQTIRKRRVKGFAKTGDTLYLYYGMRTKYCKKLREETCTDVYTIMICKYGDVILCNRRIDAKEVIPFAQNYLKKGGYFLTQNKKDQLAWRDGFRPEGSTLENPTGSFDLMFRWWKQTHELPFVGDIIYWNPNKF